MTVRQNLSLVLGERRRGAVYRIAGVAAALALAAPALVALVTAGSASATTTLRIVAARPVLPAGSQVLGVVSARRVLTGDVALEPRDAAALAAYAAGVSSPTSPFYRHYLPPGQFASQFGPSPATIQAVTADLRTAGVDVKSVSANGLLVHFEATTVTASRAFHTALDDFRLADGRTVFAPTSALQLPAAIAPEVQGIVGLDDLVSVVPGVLHGGPGHAKALAPAKTATTPGGPVACPAAGEDAALNGGLTDTQIADAYGVDGLYQLGDLGAGQTVAIFESDAFSRGDIWAFDRCYFGAARAAQMLARLHTIDVDGGYQTGTGVGEAELDIEDVSALAPGAIIDVYEAPGPGNSYEELDEIDAMVQADAARVLSSSYGSNGGCDPVTAAEEPGLVQVENTLFEQAAAQGQTFLDASGDNGSDSCAYGSTPVAPILSQGDPQDQPYVLAVGGTTITDATTPPTEQVWNDGAGTPQGGGGASNGGISSIWPAPAWQANSKVPGFDDSKVVRAAEAVSGNDFCGAAICREVPDVAAQADEFTGAVTVYVNPYGWTTFGGTSSAAPLWAAMLSDIEATGACESGGGPGFVTPKLYSIASVPSEYEASFNDTTKGNNDQYGAAGGLYPATTGYDMATGLGSPRVTNPDGAPGLAYYLCATPEEIVPTVRRIVPDAVPVAGGTVSITGSGFEHGGVHDVAAVEVGTYRLPASDYSVLSSTLLKATLPNATTQAGTGSPADGSGTYTVVVTLDDGETSAPTGASRLIYYAASGPTEVPEVDGVDLSGGDKAGGLFVRVYGSGFTSGKGTPKVTFGGAAGSDVKVVDDNLLTVIVPAYSPARTKCATKLDPAQDICQTEAQVTTSTGSSAESPIRPEFSGNTANEFTPGTGEAVVAATEFDYFPKPTVTKVSVEEGLASEAGGGVATITGTGLGELGLYWVNVGNYRQEASQDFDVVFDTATEVQVVLPPESQTTSVLSVPVTVQTQGSPNEADLATSAPSNTVPVSYAPTPLVSSIETLTPSGAEAAYEAGPATGGTKLLIRGAGFTAVNEVTFTDVGTGQGGSYGFSDATSYSLTRVTSTSVTLFTPGDNPGIDQVSVCNVSGCSAPIANGDTFTYYPLGNPSVSSLSPSSGPAGTRVTVGGANLGFVEAVYFGSIAATNFANVAGLLDSGSTSALTATAPPGTIGEKVDVRVVTLESEATGFGKSPVNTKVTYTYTKGS